LINSISSTQNYSSITSNNTKKQDIGNFSDILKDRLNSQLKGKDYLETLSDDDLSILQKEHHLANKINVDSLSEEGAENLLVADGDTRNYVDLNNDGLTEIGEAKMIVFPPPNAPDSVKDAWDKTSANLSADEKMNVMDNFLAEQLCANAHAMPDGTFRITKPGEPGYKSIFTSSAEDFSNIISNMISNISKNKSYYDNADFLLGILQDFKSNINSTI
jgi:hypothetical protein